MKKLSDLKVGDSVYHSAKGELKITRIVYNDYPIETTAGNYTIDGKSLASDANQTIYPYPVKVVPVEYCYNVIWLNEKDDLCLSSAKYKTVDDFMKATCRENKQAQLIDFTKEEV